MMLKTLRGQLVLSHILPSLLIIPLMGIALVYFLENKFILPSLANQLADDAIMIAKIARAQPQIFNDTQLSESLLKDVEPESNTRVMFLSSDGVLLASSDSADDNRLNQVLNTNGISQAQIGMISKHLDFSQGLHGEVVDVFAPVVNREDKLIGIVRLSHRYSTIVEQLMDIRFLIVGIITFGVVSTALIGFLLALNIGHPIQRTTKSIFDLAYGVSTDQLPEQGPEEIKTLQQAANFLVARLDELEGNRRQFLENLIHELGRPVGGLRMGIQVLRRGAKEDPQILDELLEGLETETSILKRLIEDLSHIYDQVVGFLELDLKVVDLSKWLPGVLQSSKEAAHKRGLEWVEEIPDNPIELEIDPQRMAQVIGNLTANAIKYTPRGGTVTVAAGEEDSNIWIRVSDSGPGISIKEQERIFDPYFRGNQKQRIKQGMGLGLTIARDLVFEHQGHLDVDSSPGMGSKFTVWLPKIKREISIGNQANAF